VSIPTVGGAPVSSVLLASNVMSGGATFLAPLPPQPTHAKQHRHATNIRMCKLSSIDARPARALAQTAATAASMVEK
jgi:hypothetical protein